MQRYAVSTNSHTNPTIQAGKRYEMADWVYGNSVDAPPIAFFTIETTDVDGAPYTANCIALQPCAFLDNETWTIIEEEEPSDD